MAHYPAQRAIQMEVASCKVTKAVVAIAHSSWFDRQQFPGEQLKLSQAFCLLWQDPESGNVWGRKCSLECNAAAAAAGLIDLMVLDRVEVEIEPNKTLGIKDDNILLKVKNTEPTGTYLDSALFNEIVKNHNKNPDKPQKVKRVIFGVIGQVKAADQIATNTLNSLVSLGILDMKEKRCGRKYPTVKPDIEKSLRDQIRSVVLDGAEPNSYIHALLIISRLADKISCCAPVMKKCFSKEEYDKAKGKMNAMLDFSEDKTEAKYKQF